MTAPLSRQRRADLRKREQGWRRIPVWFSPEDLARLSALKLSGVSEQETIRLAIRFVGVDCKDALDKTP